MRKFLNCDVLAVLSEIARFNTRIDKRNLNKIQQILIDATEQNEEIDKRFLLIMNTNKAHCLKEKNVYLKGTAENEFWLNDVEQVGCSKYALAVEINDFDECDILRGDIYEIDYHKNAKQVCDNVILIDSAELYRTDGECVTVYFEEGWRESDIMIEYEDRDFNPANHEKYNEVLSDVRKERLKERYADWSLDKLKLEYGEDGIDAYSIYQLKPDMEKYLFESYSRLEKRGFNLTVDDYSLLYTDELENQTLEDIYVKFNMEHPKDFVGHSLSISDVIVTIRNGTRTAYFVDSVGFRELPDFFTGGGMQMQKEMEM